MNVPEHIVFLSLGSNIGDRLSQLRKACVSISEFTQIRKVSSVYETAPVGPIRQTDFLNVVIEIQTDLAPQDLMMHLMHVEESLGRQRNIKWGPRNIDIDIIFFDQLILNAAGLMIPHEHYADRRFVMEPLCEIAPDMVCPVRNQTMTEIARTLADNHAVRRTDARIEVEHAQETN